MHPYENMHMFIFRDWAIRYRSFSLYTAGERYTGAVHGQKAAVTKEQNEEVYCMDALTQLVSQASDFLWNVVLIIILCGTGIYYTIRLKFIQVRKFREGWHQVFGNFSLRGKKEKSGKTGEMTSFQSVATAIAAQ